MDQTKIAFPRPQLCNKIIFRLGQFLVILIDMIAHQHREEIYAQYLNKLWPNDPNFTIGPLLFFCTLEVASVLKSKLLFEEPPQNSFFACLLQGKSCCVCELCTLEKNVGAKPLPRNLLLQMDNCMKDNKNRHLLAFFFHC